MHTTRLAIVALAAVLVVSAGTAAATPGNAPADASDPGPPSDLPDPVPEFVSDILGTIGDFLAGDVVGPLGDAVSDLTPGGDSDE